MTNIANNPIAPLAISQVSVKPEKSKGTAQASEHAFASAKSIAITNTLRATKARRKAMACRTFQLKFDTSHISKSQLDNLNLLFIESKWLYNNLIALNKNRSETNFNIFKFDPLTLKEAEIKDKDGNLIKKELNIIGSQIKQEVHSRMLDSIKALAGLKKAGFPHGNLGFSSKCTSIPLKQFGTTYKIHNRKKNYIKIQGISGYFKVMGLKQIPANAEFASATLIKNGKDFYLNVSTYCAQVERVFKAKSIGIDFGIKDSIVLSNGEKYDFNFPESKRTRKLQRKLSRKQGSKKNSKKSHSYKKLLAILNNDINKNNRKKIDAKNKIVSYLTNKYETICVQDENIKGWQEGRYGKKVHNSILGGIMNDLKLKSSTLKIIERYTPTTQPCRACHRLTPHDPSARVFRCAHCGYECDRDIHSALTIEDYGMGRMVYDGISKTVSRVGDFKVDAGRIDYKTPVEGCSSVWKSVEIFRDRVSGKSILLKPEAHDFSRG